MGAKKSDNCNSSSSGDHLSPAITHENLSIASKSQIFESNDRLNILSAVGRNMHIFTSTVETESDFFKSDPTFDSGELAHNELDTMREYIRNRGVPTWDRTDACNKALKPSRMESLSWSTVSSNQNWKLSEKFVFIFAVLLQITFSFNNLHV